MRRTGFRFYFILVTFFMGGCSTRPIVSTPSAEIQLPEKVAKAFEVKELEPTLELKPELIKQEIKKKIAKKKMKEIVKKNQKGKMKIPTNITPEIIGQGNSSIEIPNRRPEKDPIWVGEKVWMDVTWLGTKAGEFEMEVLPFKELNNRKVYHIKATAVTSDLFSLIYKAQDWVETFVDFEGWFPYKFVLHGDETRHIRDTLELFDHGYKKQYMHLMDNFVQKGEIEEKKEINDLTPFTQDALSALYYIRNFDLEVGKTFKFPMTTTGKQWETNIEIVSKEEVSTKMGYLKSIKTRVETRFNGLLQQNGDAYIWFSDDEKKLPLRFEAKVKIGWIAGIAKKLENGTPPDTSK